MKKLPKTRPPRPIPKPSPLITSSPAIGTPTLGQVHRLGAPPHELHAEPLVVSPVDIAPRARLPVTKAGVAPGKKKRVRLQGVILDGLLQELLQKWPLGFDGKKTSFVHREIKKRRRDDRDIDPPSVDTIARHLGRRND